LPTVSSSRLGLQRPAKTSGKRASTNATTTAIGTTAIGIANSNGTNASCVGTVNPNGMSKRTRVASPKTSRHNTGGRSANACGGRTSQNQVTAAANPSTEVRNMLGSVGVNVSVAYMGTNTWGSPQASGTVTGIGTGWTLPKAIKIKPGNVTGWQLAQFTLVAAGSSSEYQISNLYVDPRMH
jgi:hypothetical protein